MTGRPDPLESALRSAFNQGEPDGPECHLCGNAAGPWLPDPSGARWPSGAQMLICSRGCPEPTATEATDVAAKGTRDAAQAPAGEPTLSSDAVTTWNRITVLTSDHGPVETLCPDWCTGDGHPDGHQRDDITHHGEDTDITVDTPRGTAEFITLGLEQRPFTSTPMGTAVRVSMFFTNFDGWATSTDDLDALAVRINAAIETARTVVRRLEIQAQGGAE